MMVSRHGLWYMAALQEVTTRVRTPAVNSAKEARHRLLIVLLGTIVQSLNDYPDACRPSSKASWAVQTPDGIETTG